jgi:alkylated DNA repair dioxygenase AlkB
MKAPVEYLPKFVPDPDAVFEALKALEYERRDTTPRSEFFASDHPYPYAYGRGKGARTYLPRSWPSVILPIRTALEAHTGAVLDVCFVNRYLDQSDHLGWHADDSPEMDDERPIISVSFGVAREIWFRPLIQYRCNQCGMVNPVQSPEPRALHHKMSCFSGELRPVFGEVTKALLEHGSVCIMQPHMQETWEHRIPKASFTCGERISLVFRGYVVPSSIKGSPPPSK